MEENEPVAADEGASTSKQFPQSSHWGLLTSSSKLSSPSFETVSSFGFVPPSYPSATYGETFDTGQRHVPTTIAGPGHLLTPPSSTYVSPLFGAFGATPETGGETPVSRHYELIPGSNSELAATMPRLYEKSTSSGASAGRDRPFKCDHCPQSFRRNHDLKRHKMIHLALKPFPCGYCGEVHASTGECPASDIGCVDVVRETTRGHRPNLSGLSHYSAPDAPSIAERSNYFPPVIVSENGELLFNTTSSIDSYVALMFSKTDELHNKRIKRGIFCRSPSDPVFPAFDSSIQSAPNSPLETQLYYSGRSKREIPANKHKDPMDWRPSEMKLKNLLHRHDSKEKRPNTSSSSHSHRTTRDSKPWPNTRDSDSGTTLVGTVSSPLEVHVEFPTEDTKIKEQPLLTRHDWQPLGYDPITLLRLSVGDNQVREHDAKEWHFIGNESDGATTESTSSRLSDIVSSYDSSTSVLELYRSSVIRLLISSFVVSLKDGDKSSKSNKRPKERRDSKRALSTSNSQNIGPQGTKRKREPTSNGKKRIGSGDEDDEDEDDDKAQGGCTEDNGQCNPAPQKLLACPFCKSNPRRYRSCYKYVLKDISRLKQHLSRCHRIPIHCAICSEVFSSEEDRDGHLREQSCEKHSRVQWDGINEKQRKQLEQRISTRTTMEENWYLIYEILFPGHPRPESPYIGTVLSADLLALQDFFFLKGAAVVRQVVNARLPPSLQPHEDETQAFVETIFQDAVGIILERWEAANQGLSSAAPLTRGSTENHSRPSSGSSSATRESDQDGSSTKSNRDATTPVTEPDNVQMVPCEPRPDYDYGLEEMGLNWSLFNEEFDDFAGAPLL